MGGQSIRATSNVAAGLLEEPPEGELDLAGLLGPGDVVVVQRVRAGDDRDPLERRSAGSGRRGRGRRRRRRGRRRSTGSGRSSVAWGPKSPWVSDACGSMSTSRTRRPSLAKAPARWWHVEVLPQPPLRLSIATVIGPVIGGFPPVAFPGKPARPPGRIASEEWDRHFPRETGRPPARFPGKPTGAGRARETIPGRTRPDDPNRPDPRRRASRVPGKTNPDPAEPLQRCRTLEPRRPGKTNPIGDRCPGTNPGLSAPRSTRDERRTRVPADRPRNHAQSSNRLRRNEPRPARKSEPIPGLADEPEAERTRVGRSPGRSTGSTGRRPASREDEPDPVQRGRRSGDPIATVAPDNIARGRRRVSDFPAGFPGKAADRLARPRALGG